MKDSLPNSLLDQDTLWNSYTGQSISLEGLTHVFSIDVTKHAAYIRLKYLLSRSEGLKIDRYQKLQDRNIRTIAKVLLRIILGKILGIPPDAVVFYQGLNEKPMVKGVHFNLSHTSNNLTIVISEYPVGIDTEWINADFQFESLLNECFTPMEVDFINKTLDKDPGINFIRQRMFNFFLLWTRKEAILKATGEGLLADLKTTPAIQTLPLRNGHYYCLNSYHQPSDHITSVAFNTGSKIKLWEYEIYV